MKCTCKCKITILKETQESETMQFPEFQVTGPSEQHCCLRPVLQHRFARLGKAKPSGFPSEEPPSQLSAQETEEPPLPTSWPSPPAARPGLTSLPQAWDPRPQSKNRRHPMPKSHFTWLFRGTEAAQPRSVPAGRRLDPGYPCSEGDQSHTWEGSLHRLPNESESHLRPTTSCSAVVAVVTAED